MHLCSFSLKQKIQRFHFQTNQLKEAVTFSIRARFYTTILGTTLENFGTQAYKFGMAVLVFVVWTVI